MGISGLKFLLFRMFWVRMIRMHEFLLSFFFFLTDFKIR